MAQQTLKSQFSQAVQPSIINDWELEELIELFHNQPTAVQKALLKEVAVIWPVSNALCQNFLAQSNSILQCLSLDQLPKFVRDVLDAYESGGLHAARKLLFHVEDNFLCGLKNTNGISLQDILSLLQTYVHGLAGQDLELIPGKTTFTDTHRIVLPQEISAATEKADNFLAYKLTVSYQWAHIVRGTYTVKPEKHHKLEEDLIGRYKKTFSDKDGWLNGFLQLFPRQGLATTLYHLLETARHTVFLWHELPGLMRDTVELRKSCSGTFLHASRLDEAQAIFQLLQANILSWQPDTPESLKLPANLTVARAIKSIFNLDASADESIFQTSKLYELCLEDQRTHQPLFFQGELHPRAAHEARLTHREKSRQEFIEAMGLLIPSTGETPVQEENEPAAEAMSPAPIEQNSGLIMPVPENQEENFSFDNLQNPQFITINDEKLLLPEDLQSLSQEIIKDLGHIPARYISSAMQQSGHGSGAGAAPVGDEGASLAGTDIYDEWDYRRNDFRKQWCRLIQKKIQPVEGTFVSHTLNKYKWQLTRLRRQFEMLRTQERFLKRQRDGDDIDLDSVIESIADTKAGVAGSDRHFIRLVRDERDIAAIFLVDMSSSTEGWISKALKESLILMCESLEMLGDRYAIYGFSGMRRSRSELFHVKDLDEPYNDEVKARIAAIAPQEYTRMGPPIRHITEILDQVDAKVRLLITLSDGKPEDYDDYKGDYAIEDTRHALIEAKTKGIHPFCITIDHQAHDYIAHMYGEVNYIFIDDVNKLPNRIPDIYRALTT